MSNWPETSASHELSEGIEREAGIHEPTTPPVRRGAVRSWSQICTWILLPTPGEDFS